MTNAIGETLDDLQPLLWDQHCCLPLRPDADVGHLLRFQEIGGSFVSVNVGYAPNDADSTLRILESFRRQLATDQRFLLAGSAADVVTAQATGRLAVAFDLEDANPLDGRLDMVERYHRLGVRTLVPTYNYRNAAGSGCMDAEDEGLTAYGRAMVREMNRVGIVADGSHSSIRTGLELCEVSTGPVIYSHTCMRSVWEHERNITDEQARACAATGGVIGISGVGVFLGPNDISLDALLRHLEYAIELVGPDHVGIGTDYPFDIDDFNRELTENAELFPESYTRWGPIRFVEPETLSPLAAVLADRGYPDEAITGILGGNFLRVARQAWNPEAQNSPSAG
ncbi:dipeptidase [Actinoallomurus spadix]|uniref:dipeptidase n=1 Tax=Actinoallomurus spadix TaxID=79912 RepID=UPI002092AC6D|nr:membrane dipeptidase [Actinoallomurus spadix]MCO5986603.1 dipeptidase [Actinoallomurus spadix]